VFDERVPRRMQKSGRQDDGKGKGGHGERYGAETAAVTSAGGTACEISGGVLYASLLKFLSQKPEQPSKPWIKYGVLS
jgi:hypothetical protein